LQKGERRKRFKICSLSQADDGNPLMPIRRLRKIRLPYRYFSADQ
jgi:hypothetical protein